MSSALDPPLIPGHDRADESLLRRRELFDVPEDVAYLNVANLAPHLRSALSRR